MLRQAPPSARIARGWRGVGFLGTVLVALGGLPLAASSARAQAGTGTVTGIIRDAETGNPMDGASVQLRGTLLTTITNEQGRFTIRASRPGRTRSG